MQELLIWNTPRYSIVDNVVTVSSMSLTSACTVPRQSNDRFYLKYKAKFGCKTRYFSRSFADYASSCWNKIPYSIRSIQNKQSFLKSLRTYYSNMFLSE